MRGGSGAEAPPPSPSVDEHPKSATRLLLRAVGRSRAPLTGFLLLLTTWQLCESMVPVLIGVIIDRAVDTGDLSALFLWGAVLVVLFAVLSYSYRFGARIGFGIVQREMHQLRLDIAGRELDPRGVRSGLIPGETLSLATSDVELVGWTIRSLGYAVAAAVAVVVSAVVLLRIDIVLGLVVLLGVPAVLLVIQVVTPAIARRTRDQQALIAHTSGVATDLIRGLRGLKGIGAEAVASSRYRVESDRARAAGIRTANSYGVMGGLTTGLSGLFLAVVALLAGVRALEGEITIGELIAIVGLSQFLAEPINILGHISAQVAGAHASAGRIVSYLGAPPLVPAGDRSLEGEAPTLDLTEVHVDSLAGLTVRSRPGELLGLAVADPADAAALVGVLAEGRTPEVPDAVRLGGVPLHDLHAHARRGVLVVAPHHVDLFEGTVRSNVDPDGTHDEHELTRLVDASAVTDVLDLHPDRLERPVTPDGATFSGGQRQRIAYARALASAVPILVLHDPTTAVDAVTEHRMAEGLRRTRHANGSRLTTWVLTSSPALLAQADRVVLVRDGRVVAEGSHAELTGHDDYRDLVLR